MKPWTALNALNAAAKYLNKGDRVVVIDRNQTWGGQWLGQYDFVRLHQPYFLFTAGDQRWTLGRDRSHLATRREVLDHLATVPAISAGHLEVTPVFRHEYRGHQVHEGRVEIDAAPLSNDGEAPRTTTTVRIRARRLLKGTGRDVELLPPFRISSTRVRSVGVSDPALTTPEFLEGDAPVYVIGGGKTAMDTILHLARVARRGGRRRPLHLIAGSGMWFAVRDNFFPPGRRRHTGGTLTADAFLRMCELFDGQNEAAVMASLERQGLVMNVFGHAGNYRLALLSFAERDEIRTSVQEAHRGHLVDVNGVTMTVREGAQRRDVPVADGSWFKFRGDLSKWYPLHRQLPVMLRVVSKRGEILRKAEELLKSRYSDALDTAPLPSKGTSHSRESAQSRPVGRFKA